MLKLSFQCIEHVCGVVQTAERLQPATGGLGACILLSNCGLDIEDTEGIVEMGLGFPLKYNETLPGFH